MVVFLYIDGVNNSSIGQISRRPISILSERMIFETGLNILKLPAGPTISRPGPMLFRQAITAVTVTSVLKPSIRVKRNMETIEINQYTAKYAIVFLITVSLFADG